MKEALQKAIEAGYEPKDWKEAYKFSSDVFDMKWANQWFGGNYKIVLLDILFWQCLGKGLGWCDGCQNGNVCFGGDDEYGYYWGGCPSCVVDGKYEPNDYLHHWHKFIDHIAEKKDTDDFFKELLK